MTTHREVLRDHRNRAFRLLVLSFAVLLAGIVLATLAHSGPVGVVLLAAVFLGLTILAHRALHGTCCPACRRSWYHLIPLIDRLPLVVRRAQYCPFCGIDLDLPVAGPIAGPSGTGRSPG
jgi:hypothetical protein